MPSFYEWEYGASSIRPQKRRQATFYHKFLCELVTS